MMANWKILLYLKTFYKTITITCNDENYYLIKQNFGTKKIIKEEEFLSSSYTNIFFILDHLLEYNGDILNENNYFYVDEYLNIAHVSEINSIQSSYHTYVNMFENIYKPVMKRKFELIRNKRK